MRLFCSVGEAARLFIATSLPICGAAVCIIVCSTHLTALKAQPEYNSALCAALGAPVN